MGDRNNPIKFGPAWMRNFGQISSSGGTTNSSQNNTNSRNGTTTAPKGPVATSSSVSYSEATNTQGQSGEGTSQVSTSSNTTSTTNAGSSGNNEMILAEMRYGREEMLALYERTTDAPEQLKYFDQLYQQRRKPPVALNNTFQEEMQRENTRGAKPATTSRNLNHAPPNENRRTRTPFPRNASSGKGILWNMAQKNTRPPTYHSTFEANTAIPWGGNNGNTPQPPPPSRPHIEQHERSGSKVYRRRVNNNTNWRQHSREEDEWRSRNRPNAERDWGERPVQGKQSTWTANRSGWVGGETNNEESLPEWAVENAVGRTGTFDSTGAFHGYSNDDTNLPKTTETSSSFTLVRSLTHGSLVHNLKTAANGFEEWWASDKAKKLSPNKFETTDVKFKQASNMGPSDDNIPTKISKEENRQEETNINSEETDKNEISETSLPSTPKAQDSATYSDDVKETSLKSKFVESKTFDALMRSDINLEKVTDNRGNFQSVLITTNNTLRQKHQNIVTSNENMQKQPRMPILHRLHSLANEVDANTTSKNLVEEMFNLTVDDSKISTSTAASPNANASGNQTDLQMPTQIPSSSTPLSSPRQSMGAMQASDRQSGGVQSGGVQSGGVQSGGIQSGGKQAGSTQASGMQASGMQAGGMQVGLMQVGGMQTAGMQGIQAGGMQSGGLQATMQAGGMQVGAIQAGNMQSGGMPGGGMQGSNMQAGGMQGGNMQGGNMQGVGMQGGNMQAVNMQAGGMQAGHMQGGIMQAGGMQAGNMQGGIMQAGGMQLHTGVGGRGGYESMGMQHNTMQQGGMHFAAIHPGQLHASGMQTVHAIHQSLLQQAALQSSAMQGAMQPGEMQANMLQSGRDGSGVQGALQAMQVARMGNALQNIGVPNQALNNAMGLPTSGNGQVIPMPGVSRPVMQNPNVMGLCAADMQPNGSMMSAYHQQGGLSMMSGANVHNSSLYMGHTNNSMQAANEMHRARPDLYQTGQQQAPYGSMYNMIAQSNNGQPLNNINVLDQWYYEDPQYNVHGPFSSKDMYNWYRAGFFNANLMIRRACDPNMSRLGSYGPMAFGAPIDLLPPYPPPSGYDRRTQGPLELLNQKGLGLEESLWHQSAQSPDMLWMAHSVDATNESRVNNLPMHFWDTEPSTLTSKSLLPEKTDKEMKAEDQMAAQLRALQNVNTLQTLPLVIKELPGSPRYCDSKPEISPNFLQRLIPNLEEIQKILKEKWLVTIVPTHIKIKEDNVEPSALTSKSILPEKIDKDVKSEDQVPVQLMPSVNNQSSASTTSSDSQSEVFPLIHERTTPNLEEIQNLLQIKWLVTVASSSSKSTEENEEPEVKGDQVSKEQEPPADISNGKQEPQSNSKLSVESKAMKSTKPENDKAVKGKTTKSKNKKTKVGKKEEVVEAKAKEIIVKTEIKKSDETTPSKNKKEDKQNRKEVEKDVKEGIVIKEEVKGSDKGVSKDSKKKENAKGSDGGDCNRKEVAVDEKKGKKNIEKSTNDKKQQPETQSAVETVQSAKKTPWSDAASAQTQSANNYSMTLTNIQRLEREKKMEEIKMQQRMIQIIASQQAETLAREKIMQARLHWAKTRPSSNVALQITDLQAEARMQAAAETSAAAMAQAYIDPELLLPPIPNTPWATSGKTDPPAPIGFWDAQPNNGKVADKPQEAQKVEESNTPTKKMATTPVNIQKEVSPAVLEFDSWCKNVLMVWDKTIDVTTFVSFLKDIESPYDVKDYVKFYLGDSKDANDFARQFLEKRSKLLRVGTVTPSDDLCSPAMAINPRMSLNSGYQEVKGKGKKTKKNKMLKIDSRILGFSVTAAEDRINVGHIDTA